MRDKSFSGGTPYSDAQAPGGTSARESSDPLAAEAAPQNHQALNEELNRVKQKYRAAQHDVERERRAHAATRAQLASLQNRLARYESSPFWAVSLALVRFWMRLANLARMLGGAPRKRRREAVQAMAASGLFDAQWYLRENPDVAAAGLDPLVHFYENGWREGRDPGPLFATSAYLKSNPDVARSGVNALLHYIEHGQAEGRAVRASTASAAPPVGTRHDFPPPAAVYRGDMAPDRPTAWQRWYRLSTDRPDAFEAGGTTIGFVGDSELRRSIDAAFQRLATLSGLGRRDMDQTAAHCRGSPVELVDAWFVNRIQLRTRWRDKASPIVVRAFQHDPSDGSLALVAEALAESEMDPVDLSLVDPWFPVLMLFGRPDGALTGTRLLAFPSLCRGGLHYPELLALSAQAPDPLTVGLGLSEQLESALGNSRRLVRSIAVDVEGADGTSPLFDRAFRRWLDKVAAVPVGDGRGAKGAAADLLGRVEVDPDAGGTLLLPADTVPSLSVLTLVGAAGSDSRAPVFLPIVVAGSEPSQPATLIEPPPTATPALAKGARGYAATWPRLAPAAALSLPSIRTAYAIRIPAARMATDAELLVPAMGSSLPLPDKPARPVTWVVFAREWRAEDVAQSIQALSAQAGAQSGRLAIVGDVDDRSKALATELFGDRLILVADGDGLAGKLTTPLVCYVGSGVILHDSRSTAFLAHLLDEPEIASAACPLVSAERRGKSWHVSVVDSGRIATADGSADPGSAEVAQLLWRSAFTVAQPPADMWVARSSAVKKWLGDRRPQRLFKGAHVCTTLITASYLAGRSGSSPEMRVPPAPQESAVKATALFG